MHEHLPSFSAATQTLTEVDGHSWKSACKTLVTTEQPVLEITYPPCPAETALCEGLLQHGRLVPDIWHLGCTLSSEKGRRIVTTLCIADHVSDCLCLSTTRTNYP